MRRLTINIGFITNSSSIIHYFAREILDDPQVKAFIEKYEISKGYVGDDLWDRGRCSSFLVTQEQFDEAKNKLAEVDYCRSAASLLEGGAKRDVVVIYGDEYHEITHILCHLLSDAAKRMHLSNCQDEFN